MGFFTIIKRIAPLRGRSSNSQELNNKGSLTIVLIKLIKVNLPLEIISVVVF